VLFERICRENGITQRLTRPRSPTTTGKIERLHKTLQQELLNVHGPFASIADAQAERLGQCQPRQSHGQCRASAGRAAHHLRLDGPVAHILSGGTLARTVACLPEPLTVTRRVSVRGAIMIGGQRIQVGLAHARKTAEVTVDADAYQITVEPGITITAPRTTSSDIRRHKVPNYSPEGQPGIT
jgi:hypothetical protein